MIPRKAKRDISEPEIVDALTQCGFAVERMDTPVDLLVSFRKRCWLIEVKSSEKGYGKSLNPNQQKFADRWKGPDIVILRNAQEAVDWAVQAAQETA